MQSKSGFTIVELLIVIVVIAILAAITVVSYNGIQQRAKLSTAQTELSNLTKTVSLFQVDESTYPNDPSEWTATFKKANMFDNTRVQAVKSFIMCSSTSGNTYTVIAVRPISIVDTNGQLFHYRDQTGAKTFVWDNSFTGTFSAERACKQTTNGFEFAIWAHDLT